MTRGMLSWVLVLELVGCLGSGCQSGDVTDESTALAAEPLVPVADVHPGIRFDIRYATSNNFTGQVLYSSDVCLLRLSVAERLARVQSQLEAIGLGLLVFDGYRPLSVQEKMWQMVPDENYVANPQRGSRHNRGAAVDVTLVDGAGRPLEMPTDFDDFSEAAHRDFMDCSETAIRNRTLLDQAMRAEGFVGLTTEWWHYDAENWEDYPVLGVR